MVRIGQVLVGVVALAFLLSRPMPAAAQTDSPATRPAADVEQWGVYEIKLNGPRNDGNGGANPFDVKLSADFTLGDGRVLDRARAHGFYDGDGVYVIRFMAKWKGTWRYTTRSDLPELSGKTGQFTVGPPSPGNRGPVGVKNVHHFAYADGTPFTPISTTLYGWVNQRSDALQEQTLTSLKTLPFNRVRMCVLPINYGEDNVPTQFPFEEHADGSWDYDRMNPAFFRNIEKRLTQLQALGIEAELILFHSRDGGKTGYDDMPPEADDRYLRYTVARLAAFRNVWWNLANEFDNIQTKADADWDRFFEILRNEDPYQHLRSIHQMNRYYDFFKPGPTYLSVQNSRAADSFGRALIYRILSRKPVIFDEVQYEGDAPKEWGRLPAVTMVERFWNGIVGGTYVTHGETYANAPGTVWISRGGKLVGESPKRLAFLKQVLDDAPPGPLNPLDSTSDSVGIAGKGRLGYYLVYFAENAPTHWNLDLPQGRQRANYRIDILDTWDMTVTPVEQTFTVYAAPPPSTKPAEEDDVKPVTTQPVQTVKLPGKPYIALRIQRVN